MPWVAAACALLGASLAVGEACERRASESIAAAEARTAAADEERTRAWLHRAALCQPFDPNLPLLRARLASLAKRPDDTLAALLEARELFPGSATLAHQAALVLSGLAPADPRIDSWLGEAVRLDPFGPESWRRHLDRSRVAARALRAEDSLASLLAAVLLNPSAVAGLPRTGSGAEIVLHPAGPDAPGIPVARLQAALAERRAQAQDVDPDEASRLRLRGIELLQALGELQAADALAHELLAGNELYLQTRTAQTRLAEGRYEEAAERLRGILRLGAFWTHGDLLEALSRSTPLDADAFGAQLAETFARMARDVDVVFELETVRKLLRARQRCAERTGDLTLAIRLADANDFARR